ncbi:MAG: hypothetical protein DRH08_00165 [Deltaproteobacteria bacterium]|nr:MAG: hypothetical protein DRH08_00165 [Deltaproteobacteria bacterium]
MALFFLLEDGTGLVNSTSYADDAEALQYLENLGRETTWVAEVDLVVRQSWLNEATAYIDQKYGPLMRGIRASRDQALNVPRHGAIDNDGYVILSDDIVPALKAATIEAADRRAAGTVLLPDATVGATGVTREKVKVGPLERDISYTGGGKSTLPRFSVITRILVDAGIIDGGDRVFRM